MGSTSRNYYCKIINDLFNDNSFYLPFLKYIVLFLFIICCSVDIIDIIEFFMEIFLEVVRLLVCSVRRERNVLGVVLEGMFWVFRMLCNKPYSLLVPYLMLLIFLHFYIKGAIKNTLLILVTNTSHPLIYLPLTHKQYLLTTPNIPFFSLYCTPSSML